MIEKRYGYTYDGSALAAREPLTEEQIIKIIDDSLSFHRSSLEKFQVYELIPVKIIPHGYKLERA